MPLPKPRSRSRPCERAAARVRYSTPGGSGNRRDFVDQALHAGWEERGLVLDPNSHLRPGIRLLMAPKCAARVAEAPAVLSASLVQGKPAPTQVFRWKVCDSMCLVLQTSQALWNAPSGWCSGSQTQQTAARTPLERSLWLCAKMLLPCWTAQFRE